MIPCPYCPEEKATPQGLSGHIRMKHPGESSNSGGARTSSDSGVQSTRQALVSDAGAVLDNRAIQSRTELEQRFIRTLDELDQVPRAIEEMRESIAELKSQVGEEGALMDRLTNIDLALYGLMDRVEEDYESDAPEESQTAQVAEPKRSGFWASDDEIEEAFPGVFGGES
jgi:hypothetical protein